MTPDTDPERALLLACARTELDDDGRRRIEGIADAEVDWNRTLELAGREGVTPLLHRAVERHGDRVPDAALEQARDRARSIATRNLLAARELIAIVQEFEEAGIPALPFKGPPLSVAAYGDLGLREFVDLDVLVPEEEIPRAADRLESMGYSWFDGTPRLDDSAVLGGPFTPPIVPEFRLGRDGTIVELRYQVGERAYPVDLDFETLWSRRDAVTMAGTTLPSLDAEDRILVLAYHGSKHCWARLKWVCDLVEAIESAVEIDWDHLLARATEIGARRRLLVSLGVTVGLLDADVPERLVAEVWSDRLARGLVDRTLDGRHELTESARGANPRVWYNAFAADSLGDAVAPIVHAPWFTPGIAEYRILPLPGAFHPLYYPVRPFRGVVSALRRKLQS